MNIAFVLPGYLSGVIALAGLAFTIWAAHNRSEVDDLDRSERQRKEAEAKVAELERDLRDVRRENESIRRENLTLMRQLLGFKGTEGGK